MTRITDQSYRIMRLRAEGLTYAQVASIIGCSRSAVAGAVARMRTDDPASLAGNNKPIAGFPSQSAARRSLGIGLGGRDYAKFNHILGGNQ